MASRVDITFLENDMPQVIMRKGFHTRGRPRITPKELTDNKKLLKALGKKVKELKPIQRKTYNRIASRNSYSSELIRRSEKNTSKEYKEKIGKKIKDFTKKQKQEYDRLARKESRLKHKLAKQ
tara:strand:- start:183 stop:551 length:369 start_codon:yes stop_codon:yes gene_type:complete